MSADQDVFSYRKRLSNIAAESDGRTLFNKSPSHTSIAIATIIEKSSNYIYIITDDLGVNLYCTPEILSALISFVSGDQTRDVKIISKYPIATNHPWKSTKELLKHQEQIRFTELPTDWSISYYYVLGDGKNFRYENKASKTPPIVQFGNTKMGSRLQEQFEQLEVDLERRSRHIAA